MSDAEEWETFLRGRIGTLTEQIDKAGREMTGLLAEAMAVIVAAGSRPTKADLAAIEGVLLSLQEAVDGLAAVPESGDRQVAVERPEEQT